VAGSRCKSCRWAARGGGRSRRGSRPLAEQDSAPERAPTAGAADGSAAAGTPGSAGGLELPGDPVAARLIAAREADRAGLARSLHDEAAQTLANLSLHLQICERAIQVDVERGKSELQSSRQALGDAITRLRRQVFELRPQILEEVGVAQTLRRYASQIARDGPAVELQDGLGGTRLPHAVELGLYRVGQAALANAVSHAAATRVRVSLGARDGEAWLEVGDDGKGFDARAELLSPRDGAGLALMQDWAAALGGSLSVEGKPPGTTVRIEVPVR
jgi:two-component system sensor histidine kinase DegS